MSLSKAKKAGAIGFISLSAVFMSACSSISQTNADLFSGIHEIQTRVDTLQDGMSLQEVSEKLGVHPNVFYKLDRAELLRAQYGAEPRINVDSDRLQEIGDTLSRTEGYEISYKEIKESWTFSNFGTRIKNTVDGERMKVVFIFQDGKLTETVASGGPVNDVDRDSIVPKPAELVKFGRSL